VNWYNSLSVKGNLNWNTGNDLCGQESVTCDSSTPQRVSRLYSFSFLFPFSFLYAIFIFLVYIFALFPSNREVSWSIKGTIPTEFGRLTYLQHLYQSIHSFLSFFFFFLYKSISKKIKIQSNRKLK